MNDYLFPFPTKSIFGFNIIEAPRRPKMQLSEDCPVTDDFRKEINAWMIEFFGYDDTIKIGTAYMFGNNLVMRPETAVMLTNIV